MDSDNMISIKCNLCKCRFKLPVNTAKKLAEHNDGYVPCEKCGSHATTFDPKLLKEA